MLVLFTLVYIVDVKDVKKEHKTEHEQTMKSHKWW